MQTSNARSLLRGVDGRDKPGHDGGDAAAPPHPALLATLSRFAGEGDHTFKFATLSALS